MTLEEFRKTTAHLPGSAVLVCKGSDGVWPFYGLKAIKNKTLVCITGQAYREKALLDTNTTPAVEVICE